MPDASARVVDLSDETPPLPAARAWRRALAWCAGWTAVALAMSALVSAQKTIPLRYTLPSELVNYYGLAAASLVVWFASAAMAARRWRWPAQAAVQLGLAIVLIAAWQATYGAYLRHAIGPRAWASLSRESGLFQLMNAVVFYGGVVGGTLAVQAARRAREQERRQHALELLARDAERRALMARLEPHFLLNALTSVLALVDNRPAEARAMIERLAELLTAAFDGAREAEVTLGREVEMIGAYLAIEQVRLGDRLRVAIDVPTALHGVAVPPFVLQPLVENAVRYAVAPSSVPGTVVIRARESGNAVRLEVCDSGGGFDRGAVPHEGHGIALTEQRLQAFAPGARLVVERHSPTGCTVALTFTPQPEPLTAA